MSRRPTLEQHGREILSLPADWQVVIWKATDSGVTITGAVMPEVFKSGPRKGHKKWSKRDLSTECTLTIPDPLHDKWLAGWEAETGKCHKCDGSGQVFKSWNVNEGTKYKECSRCSGTGDAFVKETQ